MTRINLIPVDKLSDQHLLAEMRELPRIFTYVEKYGIAKDIPKTFCLGAGHVKFFTNKLMFLMVRYEQLINEWQRRGFNWSYDRLYFKIMNINLIQNTEQIVWAPNASEVKLSQNRINEKLKTKPNFYKYHGVLI